MSVEVASEEEMARAAEEAQAKAAAGPRDLAFTHADFQEQDLGAEEGQPAQEDASVAASGRPVRREFPKVGRNDPCPCGSGKKFKACHGSLK
jgi:preprotein translocase subunit SecA